VGELRRSRRIEVVGLERELIDAAWARCKRFRDKEWDWIDCVSFELMERRRIRTGLTLDHHCREAGFLVLP
jgi:predicted nucleic acid-binding protein